MRYIYNLLLLCMTTVFAGCYDDLGNYDYKDLNEVTINGIKGEGFYEVIAHLDTLRIVPELESSLDGEKDYTYEWKFIPQGADKNVVGDTVNYVVAETRDLNWPVVGDAGEYRCFYTVTDQETGIRFTQKFFMKISTLTSEGWMVLCDQNGEARLDMIVNAAENDDKIARDIWSESTYKVGRPNKVMFNYYMAAPPSILTTENGSWKMDEKDLHVGDDNNLKWSFGSTPEKVRILASGVSLYSWDELPDLNEGTYCDLYWVVVDDKGDVYTNKVNEVGALFEFPVNKINGQPFEAAPFVGTAIDTRLWVGCHSIMLYDQTNQRFVELKATGGGGLSVMNFKTSPLFEAEQPGKKMVFMQMTRVDGDTYAILQDEAGDYFYYGINLGRMGENTQFAYGKLDVPQSNDIKGFAFHASLKWLFYYTEHEIYKVDILNPAVEPKLVKSFDNENIAVVKMNALAKKYDAPWQESRSYQLLVGTVVEGEDIDECGILRNYDFENQWNREPILVKEHTGLGNIIDVVYKES